MHQVQINATQFLNKSSAIAKLANHGKAKSTILLSPIRCKKRKQKLNISNNSLGYVI